MNRIWHDTAPLGSLASVSGCLSSNNFHHTVSQNTSPILRRADAIEVRGGPASGKTTFLESLVLTCSTPVDSLFGDAPGWGKTAIVFDCDGHWDLYQLRSLLERHLSTCSARPPDSDSLIAHALQRVHIFRPDSPLSLTCTLYGLDEYMSTQMPDEALGIILLDSISTFSWESRYATENSDLRHIRLQAALNILHHLRYKYRPLLLTSSWELPRQLGSGEVASMAERGPHSSQRPSVTTLSSLIDLSRSSTPAAQVYLHPLTQGGSSQNPSSKALT